MNTKIDAIEQTVLEHIHRDQLIELTQKLVALQTENPPADYTVIAKFMTKLYQSIGLEVHTVAGEANKPNIGARWKGTGEKKDILLLSGHMDVVPAGSGWPSNPFQAVLHDNCLFGRGTADMKGALAAEFLAVKALKKANVSLKGDLYLFATVDDETAGTMGLRYVVQEGLKKLGWEKPTFHILGEPSQLKLCVAFKGRMWIRIGIAGRSAHGGNPSAGINAIEKMVKLLPEFLAIERQTHPLMGVDTLNIGTIDGGEKTNIVPDQCSITLDYRFVAPQTSAQIEEKLKAVIARSIARDSDIVINEFTVFERREPQEVSQNNPYLQSLKKVTEEVIGHETSFNGVLSAGDSYWTILAGVPVAFYGPGDMGVAHTNKEHLPIDELVAAARIFSRYAVRTLC